MWCSGMFGSLVAEVTVDADGEGAGLVIEGLVSGSLGTASRGCAR